MAETINELLKFVQLGARLDLKALALEQILGLTAFETGLETIFELPELLTALISLLDDPNGAIRKDAALSLVNISAHEKGASALISVDLEKHCLPLQKSPDNIIKTAARFILDPESRIADPCCMVLSNLSRPPHLVEKITQFLDESGWNLDDLIGALSGEKYNKFGAKLEYLGPVFSNLTQSKRLREQFLDRDSCRIEKLMALYNHTGSLVLRGGVMGTLKNCCFEMGAHEWLLSDEIDILPKLLLPLAGGEEFDEEDNDKLPLDLQYLPQDKLRESDPDIRCIILEALTQLCATRQNREFFRDKNAYLILRELHKWEKDRKALLACENLVDILIRTEEEIGEDNLRNIQVPDDLKEQFEKIEQELLQES